ncbi:MAG: type II secretion system protein [Planctomycetota bacterium]
MPTTANAGFSLIEALVALVVLGTAILVGLELLGAQSFQELDTSNALRAETVISRELEKVRSSKFSTLSSTGFLPDDNYAGLWVRRTVAVVDATTRDVRIDVRWQGASENYVTRSAVTFRCKDAP